MQVLDYSRSTVVMRTSGRKSILRPVPLESLAPLKWSNLASNVPSQRLRLIMARPYPQAAVLWPSVSPSGTGREGHQRTQAQVEHVSVRFNTCQNSMTRCQHFAKLLTAANRSWSVVWLWPTGSSLVTSKSPLLRRTRPWRFHAQMVTEDQQKQLDWRCWALLIDVLAKNGWSKISKGEDTVPDWDRRGPGSHQKWQNGHAEELLITTAYDKTSRQAIHKV